MLTRRCAAAAALLCLLSACGGGGDATATTPGPLNFTVIDSSGSLSQAEKSVTAKTDTEWQALWFEHKGPTPARPAIDFQSKMVIGVFVGARSLACYNAEIKRVIQETSAIRVEYAITLPDAVINGTAGCGEAIVYPATLATIPRSDLPVTFVAVTR